MRGGRYNPGMRLFFPALAVLLLLLFSCGPSRDSTVRTSARPAGADASPGAAPEASRAIHPFFDFTAEDFPSRLADAPPEVLSDPRRFLDLAARMLDLPEDYLFPVGPGRPLQASYVPANPVSLETIPGGPTAKGRQVLDAPAAEELVRLTKAAAEDEVVLMVASAYRSWEYQMTVYDRHVRLFGEESAAGRSRPPGTSQHQLGTSVDFGFAEGPAEGFDTDDWRFWRLIGPGDPAETWLARHAGEFGWSLSYPEKSVNDGGIVAEPWHWRWIGPDAVRMQDEFFGGDQQALTEFWYAASVEIESARIGGPGRRSVSPPQPSERTS